MAKAKQGDTVRVHYTGKLDDGTTFDSSRDHDPIEFEIGSGKVIAGFEQAVAGMDVGETKTTTVSAQHAYGAHAPEMVLQVERQQIPDKIELRVGKQLQLRTPDGGTASVRVTEVSDSSVTLDANHPLAGKDLAFEIELVEILAT
jgi:FKBP-type peptidyl-prolyl cis-trans isomerase 2